MNIYVRNMCGPYILAYTNVYAIPEKVCKGGVWLFSYDNG